MLSIIHVRDRSANNFMLVHIYIGRASGDYERSPLANPYRIGYHGDRDEVIEKYRRFLWGELKQYASGIESSAVTELIRIASYHYANWDVILMCWCKPQACHGDIVIKAVEWLIKEHPELLYVP